MLYRQVPLWSLLLAATGWVVWSLRQLLDWAGYVESLRDVTRGRGVIIETVSAIVLSPALPAVVTGSGVAVALWLYLDAPSIIRELLRSPNKALFEQSVELRIHGATTTEPTPIIEMMTSTSGSTTQRVVGSPRFVELLLLNDPPRGQARLEAREVGAQILFWTQHGFPVGPMMHCRWADVAEPQSGDRLLEASRTSIVPDGQPRRLNIALKYDDEEYAFGFNNYTVVRRVDGWRDPWFQIPRGVTEVEVYLRGANIYQTLRATLTHQGKGGAPTLKTFSSAAERDRFFPDVSLRAEGLPIRFESETTGLTRVLLIVPEVIITNHTAEILNLDARLYLRHTDSSGFLFDAEQVVPVEWESSTRRQRDARRRHLSTPIHLRSHESVSGYMAFLFDSALVQFGAPELLGQEERWSLYIMFTDARSGRKRAVSV